MFVQIEQRAPEWSGEAAYVVEEETGAGGVWLDDQGLKFKGVEILFDVFVARLRLEANGGNGAGHGDFGAFALLAGHEPFNVFGLGGLDAVSSRGDEEDSGVAQGDRAVTVVGYD